MSTQPNSQIPIIGSDPQLYAQLVQEQNDRRARRERPPAQQQPSPPQTNIFQHNQRKNARYEISNPVICYPVLESEEVATTTAVVGVGVDLGTNGIKILLDSIQPVANMELVVGVEHSPGDFRFCGGIVTSVRKTSQNTHEAGIEFRGRLNEVLKYEQIIPVLDRAEMKFVLPFDESVLASLCMIGAMISSPLDAVLLCPNCHAIPTMRYGCGLCLSANVKASKMIHHFACAHVDFIENFETADGICCQKCRTRNMIIGSDYEYLEGPNQCYDCGQSNLEKIQIGHCLYCEHRFAMETAYQLNISGYRVNRLDVLDFIGSA